MIGDRVRKAREYGNFSLELFSEKLGIAKRTLQNYEKNSSEPNVSTIINIANICHINDWWLLTGKGEMLEKDEDSTISLNDGYKFDVLNVQASAGTGISNYVVEVVDTMVLDKSLFRTPPDPKKTKIIQVSGDSMEPTLSNGDYVLIDKSKNHGIDGIYAINLHNQIFIKRLQFNLDSTISIISDNSRYTTKIYDPDDTQIPLHIIGMKILSIQR